MRRDVFQAIADPTRREILNLVANELLTLNAVAEKFDISRPAVSKHVKILTQAGLVVIHQYGRERYCQAHPEKLYEVAQWIDRYRDFWSKGAQNFDSRMLNDLRLSERRKSSGRRSKR